MVALLRVPVESRFQTVCKHLAPKTAPPTAARGSSRDRRHDAPADLGPVGLEAAVGEDRTLEKLIDGVTAATPSVTRQAAVAPAKIH